MPWVGLYISAASLVCTLAMAIDVFRGFRQWKLWFPCKFFTINAASITLVAIAMKLPLDLTTDRTGKNDHDAKTLSITFLYAMVANFLPSLGILDGKELLINIIAFGIFIVTIIINACIDSSTQVFGPSLVQMPFFIFPLLWPFSVALTILTSKKVLEHRYKELHKPVLNRQEISFSFKELKHHVKKYWVMAETSNPQFVLAYSPVCCAYGFMCLKFPYESFRLLLIQFRDTSNFWYGESNYKWSTNIIFTMQLIGITVGIIAPIFRCITPIFYFNMSKEWSMNHLNVFKVEKYWIRSLQQWKQSHVCSHISGHHCKRVFHNVKSMMLNFCITLQILVVVICKMMCLIPISFLILLSCCSCLCKSLLRKFKKDSNISTSNISSEVEEYVGFVLQIDEKTKLSKRMLRNTLNTINRLFHECEEKASSNLTKFLKRSTGFNGVVEFDNDQVPPLHPGKPHYCWSLVVVSLTAIALAFPKIKNGHVKRLLSSMREGLQFDEGIEESLNTNNDMVKARKASQHVWTEVEVYYKWLQIDLRKKARQGKTTEEILQWLGDEAIKIVIQVKRCKNECVDHSPHKFIAANSMYRISQTILLHCNQQEHKPNEEEVFEWILTMIADLLCACFSNLPRAITIKCHHKVMEKREESIRSAARLLGKSKKILKILKVRQLPNLEWDSMSYIDEWHARLKCPTPINRASSSSNESLIVTIQ